MASSPSRTRSKLGTRFQAHQVSGDVSIGKEAASEILLDIFGPDLVPHGPLQAAFSEFVNYSELGRVFLTLDALLEFHGRPVLASEITARLLDSAATGEDGRESSAGVEETLDAVLAEQRRQTVVLSELVNRVARLEKQINKQDSSG